MRITPLKNYNAPNFPTLETARENPALLKNLPRRWQKKATMAACLGIIGIAGFTGCYNRMHHGGAGFMPEYVVYQTEQEFYCPQIIEADYTEHNEIVQNAYAAAREQLETTPLEARAHFGGGGFGPFYVVYFTEQEALGFIRAKLEEAGLDFSAEPPDYSVDIPNAWFSNAFGLRLYDAEKGVAISYMPDGEDTFSPGEDVFAHDISQEFAQQHENLSVGVFYNPGETVFSMQDRFEMFEHLWEESGDGGRDEWIWLESIREYLPDGEYEALRDAVITERKSEARQALIDNLTAQVQEFIDRLKTEGIL
ncbi:MAG: hypothetical protein FWE27_07340 [Defluviitaleaceae bacterium]|nr:hypothetical protein [Defluviitaleaceae bacterium]